MAYPALSPLHTDHDVRGLLSAAALDAAELMDDANPETQHRAVRIVMALAKAAGLMREDPDHRPPTPISEKTFF